MPFRFADDVRPHMKALTELLTATEKITPRWAAVCTSPGIYQRTLEIIDLIITKECGQEVRDLVFWNGFEMADYDGLTEDDETQFDVLESCIDEAIRTIASEEERRTRDELVS